jgi:hypothetical protein
MGIVYLHYWVKHDVKASFKGHLNTLKDNFAMPKMFGSLERKCDAMLDGMALDSQAQMFVQTMKNNCINILEMDKKKDCNPLWRLWLRLGANELLTMKMLKWFKLVEICMVQVLGSTKDERCFSTFSFMKNKVRNRLNTHLDMCVKMFGHTFFIFEKNSYDESHCFLGEKKTP